MKKIIEKHPYLTIVFSMILGVLITIVSGLVFFVGILGHTDGEKNDFNRVASVYNQINSDYYKKVDTSKLATGAIDGMLSTLNDPFSDYLTDSDATSLNDSVSGAFGGVGIQVVKKNHQIEVMTTIDGTPAKKAGLKAGDVILEVDGKKLTNQSLSKATTLM